MTTATGSCCAACGGGPLADHLQVARGDASSLVPTIDRYGRALGDIVRCESCGHMQLEPLPDEEILSEAYAETEPDVLLAEEAGQRATARAVLERIEAERAPGALLDVGCWVGVLLAEARERGWTTTGIEPSRAVSAVARTRFGLDVRTGDLFDVALPRGSFDAAVLGDVLEHFVDPGRALDVVGRALAPGGVVALMLPDAGSRVARVLGARWWSVLPTHVQYFTRGSVTTLLDRHGFSVRHVGTAPKAFSARYYVGRIGGYAPAAGRVLVRAAERAGVADRMVAPDFRDRMLVLAVRR